MLLLLFSCVVLAANCFMLFIVAYNVLKWPRVDVRGLSAQGLTLSLCIPARNEEHRIVPCLESAIRQDDGVLEILVYDDHSSDNTAGVVGRFSARDGRVELVQPAPLPAGWGGKTFACQQLAQLARGDWLLFLDADAQLVDPHAAAFLAGAAVAHRATFLSCWPRLATETFWEKTLMPMLGFCVFNLFPAPLALQHDQPSLGLAHGACILMRRDVYLRLGGHNNVRLEMAEDVVLARHWRARGERGVFLDGTMLVQVRMYNSFREIWRGFQRLFHPLFRNQAGFWAYTLFHATVLLAPFALLPFVLRTTAALLLALSALIILAMRLLLARRFREPLWPALFHPLGEALLIAVGVSSWWRCVTGQGVAWRDRTYHMRAKAQEPRA